MDIIKKEFSEYTFNNTPVLFDNILTYCRVVNIHDGDTCTIIFKLNDKYYKHNVRLNGIDTCEITSKSPEIKQKAVNAKCRLYNLCTNSILNAETSKKERKK
jgi:endonuclease YncB( thermonuclease family)